MSTRNAFCLILALACIASAAPAFCQTPFNFPTPTEIASATESGYAYLVDNGTPYLELTQAIARKGE
jgi:hypothetical protein